MTEDFVGCEESQQLTDVDVLAPASDFLCPLLISEKKAWMFSLQLRFIFQTKQIEIMRSL